MKESFLRRLAQTYDLIESPFPYKTKTVSFLCYKNKVLEFGVNSAKTNPYQNYWRRRAGVKSSEPSIFYYDKPHAEIICCKKLRPNFDWSKAELVVISKRKDGTFRLARPCQICSTMIKTLGIKKVWYTTPQGTFKSEVF